VPVISGWNEQKALEALNIQGYAKRGGKIAVSPIAALAYKTLFHECAHSPL
jgi:hypothetical protein